MFPYIKMKKTEKTEKKNKTGKSKVKYSCESCHYITSNKTDYFRHLKRKKHLKNVEKRKKEEEMEISFSETSKIEKKFCFYHHFSPFGLKSSSWVHPSWV